MNYLPEIGTSVIQLDASANGMHPSLVKVKQVCRSCNNGWMSLLEESVQPLLAAFSESGRRTLGADDSKVLSLWAAKTAIMYEFNDVQSRVFSAAQLRDVFVSKRVPRQTQVFVGSYCGDDGSRLRHQHAAVHQRHPDGRPGVRLGLAAETGIALGRIAFLVRTVSPASLGPLSRVYRAESVDAWQEIWPNVPDEVTLKGPCMDDSAFTVSTTIMSASPDLALWRM